MSTIAEETKHAVLAASRSTATRRRPLVAPTTAMPTPRFVADDGRSRLTGLVFQAVLFCAMCVSLLAVIQQAQSDPDDGSTIGGTGVNDAPPAVFVHAD